LERKHGLFTSEEGGFYATDNQDNPTGDIIYYFGVIDLLTTVQPTCVCILIIVWDEETFGDVVEIMFPSKRSVISYPAR